MLVLKQKNTDLDLILDFTLKQTVLQPSTAGTHFYDTFMSQQFINVLNEVRQ